MFGSERNDHECDRFCLLVVSHDRLEGARAADSVLALVTGPLIRTTFLFALLDHAAALKSVDILAF